MPQNSPKANKKNIGRILNIVFIVIAFGAMAGFLALGDAKNVAAALAVFDMKYMLAALGLMVVYWLLEAVSLYDIHRLIERTLSFRDMLSITLIGQYFNCVTPLASGGQPMQVYYFTRRGAGVGAAVTTLLSRFIVYQMVLTLYSLLLLLLKYRYFVENYGALAGLTLIGFLVNLGVIVFLVLLAFAPGMARNIAFAFVRLGGKIKLVRNVPGKIESITKATDDLRENCRFLAKRPLLVIRLFLYNAAQLTVFFSIAYVIYLGFSLSGSDWLTAVSAQSFVLMISSFVPLPGAAGAAEGTFAAFFAPILGYHTGFATFVWRVLTFYLPIVVGVLALVLAKRKF